jgi:hypothetical protein
MSCAALSSSTATARPRAAAAAAAAARGGETRMCAGLGAAAGPRRSSTSSCVLSSFRGTRVHSKARALSAPSSTTAMPLRVECANPRRVAKVQQQMRREISTMLQTDKVRGWFGGVVCHGIKGQKCPQNQNPKPSRRRHRTSTDGPFSHANHLRTFGA